MQAITNKKDFLTAKTICTFKDGTKVKFFVNPVKLKHIFLADSNEKMIFGGFLSRYESDDKLNQAIRDQVPEINLDNPGEKHLQPCRHKMTIPEEFNRSIAMELGNLVRIVYNDFDNNQNYSLYLKEGDTILTNRTDMTTKAIFQYSINPSEDSNKSEYRYTVSKILEVQETDGNKRFGFILERKPEKNNEPIYFFVFRGTIQPYEWLHDAKFKLVKPSFKINEKGKDSIKVSEGFNEIYKSMSETVDNFLDDLARKGVKKDTEIYVTGHSLGAAIATLSTLHIAENDFAPTLYAFASPRVGNVKFAEHFSDKVIYSQTFRIANCEDLVNSLPTGTITDWNGPEAKAVGEKAPNSDLLISSINKISILQNRFAPDAYEHVGQPCYFSHQTGFISSSHNMSVTYCSAIFGGELS
ncbi:lipase family protein [Nostoc sp. NMS4]|uniref:lipase family protein n=1 Tax=Nostoc sp. NMS4 TaxID=2815390 RepID=UPI0025F20B26|nr:lipase family protein [Nostoc sp. NMS4]MBN3927019.1 lipase family protein [Nostoc sp. NMS4]